MSARRPSHASLGVLVATALLFADACRQSEPLRESRAPASVSWYETAHPALNRLQERFVPVLEANRKSFRGRSGDVSGFGAGAHYPQIWLRDSATLLPVTRFFYEREFLTSWIEEHLSHQKPSGALYDWIASGAVEHFPYAPQVEEVYRDGEHVLSADKNTTEADQEASAVIAAATVFDVLGEESWLTQEIEGLSLIDRLDIALQHVTSERFDDGVGLVVNALTADWGDVSPTYADQRAIYLDDATPQVAGIYTNALVFHAARELARLYLRLGNVSRAKHWEERAASMRNVANALLWSDDAGFFRVHTLLRGAPSSDFDDSDVFAMGGNGLAALYGLATDEQAARIFASAEARRNEHGFTTIAATLLPAYPTDFFQHPILREAGSYQNGGQWDWFAGRFVLAEFQRGYAVAAQKHLLQLARRIVSHDGLYEWYTREDKPRGSAHYAGNAGALASAIFEGLFGIELRSDTVRLRVRLLDEPGEVDVSEPASGRRVFYRYLPGEGELELRLEANVSVDSLGVALPRGKRAREVLFDGAAVPFELETIGEDNYAVFVPDKVSGRAVIRLSSGNVAEPAQAVSKILGDGDDLGLERARAGDLLELRSKELLQPGGELGLLRSDIDALVWIRIGVEELDLVRGRIPQ